MTTFLAAVRRWAQDFAAGVLTLFYPSRCRSCGEELNVPGPALLCLRCRTELTLTGNGSQIGDYVVTGATPYAAYSGHPYDGPAGAAVRLLKFDGRREMVPLLVAAILPVARLAAAAYALGTLVPVPLHRRRMRERGFNQSALIGSGVAQQLNLDFKPQGLRRARYTRPQVELSAAERRANVQGVFAATEDFTDARVLLVDDVITTGATITACAQALYDAGAAAVVGVAVASGRGDDGA